MSPTRAPRPSTIAFVTTVVPWATEARRPASRHTAPRPFRTPWASSAGGGRGFAGGGPPRGARAGGAGQGRAAPAAAPALGLRRGGRDPPPRGGWARREARR